MARSGSESAADLRKRKSTAMYWLQRLVRFFLFFLALSFYFTVVEAKFPAVEKNGLVPVMLIAMVWAYFDNQVMYRYGRKRRIEEIVAEIEAKEAANSPASPKT